MVLLLISSATGNSIFKKLKLKIMKKLKIILTFIYCSAGNLVKITRRILDSLKGKAQFPNPTPALTDFEKKLEEYLLSLSAAGCRDR